MPAVKVGFRDGGPVLLKVCSACGLEKVCSELPRRSEFPLNGRKNGRARWKPVCKRCYAAEARERDRLAPEGQRSAYRRARYARLKGDREWMAIRREYARQRRARRRREDPAFAEAERQRARAWKRKKRREDPTYYSAERRAARRAAREATSSRRPQERARLSAEEFHRWLGALAESLPGLSTEELGAELGISGRTVRHVLAGEYDCVRMDTVDRALLTSPVLVVLDGRAVIRIEDLYPLEVAA